MAGHDSIRSIARNVPVPETTGAGRYVERLRLRARDQDAATHGVMLVSDALHTASLPISDVSSRILLIRTLHIGRINGGGSSASVALQIERRVRTLASSAIHAADPAAVHANVVYFHDVVEPYIVLASRWAKGERTTAWFWPRALPGFTHLESHPAAWRALALHAAAALARPAPLAALLANLDEVGAADPLLASLESGDGARLLSALGWARPTPGTLALYASQARLSARWLPLVERWTDVWTDGRTGETDARAVWLAAIALVAERPARVLDPTLAARAAATVTYIGRRSSAQATTTPDVSPARRTERLQIESATVTPPPVSSPIVLSETANITTPFVQPDFDVPEQSLANHQSTTFLANGALPSAYAGLMFMLPLLARVGMEKWLTAQPEWIDADIPNRVLRLAANRLGVPAGDAVLRALPAPGDTTPASLPTLFIAPTAWHTLAAPGVWMIARQHTRSHSFRVLYDATDRLPLAVWPGEAEMPGKVRDLIGSKAITEVVHGRHMRPERWTQRQVGNRVHSDSFMVTAWLRAAKRWLRGYTALSLRDLVVRPGAIMSTRTHIDGIFDGRSADMRLRRTGLDHDPGWLPWLGRVVQFHYLYEDEQW